VLYGSQPSPTASPSSTELARCCHREGASGRAAPGMAALEKSNANRADTAPTRATHRE